MAIFIIIIFILIINEVGINEFYFAQKRIRQIPRSKPDIGTILVLLLSEGEITIILRNSETGARLIVFCQRAVYNKR